MSRFKVIITLIVAIVLLPIYMYADNYADSQVIVKYKDGYAATRSLAINSRNVMAARSMPEYVDENIFLIRTTDNVTNSIDILMQDPNVLYAQPNFIKYASVTLNDPAFTSIKIPSKNYQFKKENGINAVTAWDNRTDASSVIVAVVDTGIKLDHEDLAANVLKDDGYDAFGINGGEDGNGHGTHVAGIIGAEGNNAKGTVGITWKVKMIPLRVLNDKGEGSTATTIPAFQHLAAKNAKVVNMSLGGAYDPTGKFDRTEYDTLKNAIDSGIVIIAAAGNDNRNTDNEPEFPAAYGLRGLISVGASDTASSKAIFASPNASCYGQTTVHLFAPGYSIFSTYNGSIYDYKYLSGTSMATPVVAGAVALMLAKDPELKPWQVEQVLINSARPLAPLKDISMAGGILDLDKALSFDKRLLFQAPSDLNIEPLAGTGRTVKISWGRHIGQTEIWARTNTTEYKLIDRIAPGSTEYIDRVEGNDTGKRYYRIRGLKHATYTPFVRKSIRTDSPSQITLEPEFVNISARKSGEAPFSGYSPIEADNSEYVEDPDNPPVTDPILEVSWPDPDNLSRIVFDNTAAGKSSPIKIINVANKLKNSVRIELSSLPAEFPLQNQFSTCTNRSTLNVGDNCTIVIKFMPKEPKIYHSTLTVSSNQGDTVDIPLLGKGLKAASAPASGGCTASDNPDTLFLFMLLFITAKYAIWRKRYL